MAEAPAANNAYGYNANPTTDYNDRIVTETMQEFSQFQLWRCTHAGEWEEIAELIDPPSRNTFFYGAYNWPGQKKTDRQVDATAMRALNRFSAILDSLLTPRNMLWHQLVSPNADLMKDRDVRLWFEAVTRILFQQRYSAIANFSANNQMIYRSLGAFGNGGMFVDQATDAWNNPMPAIRYKAVPIGELFFHENHQGIVDGFIRWFRLSARQAIQKWGRDTVPPTILAAADQKSEQPFNFLHRVCPRADYEYGRLDKKGKPWASYYVSVEGRCLLSEGGYNTFPMAITRYVQTPGEVYGRGPASFVLPAIKTLNAEKRTFLTVGHRAGNPVLLTADDGLVDISLRPGAINKGGVTSDGKLLIQPLPTGAIQTTLEMMQEEAKLIDDEFLVTLFQILTETPTMTATEVVERTNEKGILLAPTVGRQQSEYLGPLIDRELALLSSFPGVLPPMPPALREARGEYNPYFTSPLARAQRAQEVAGFQRTLQSTLEIVNATQDPSVLDAFDFDVATRETADIQAVPTTWMASDRAVAQKRQARAKAQQQQAQIQAMPAQAAMMKAQATAAKAAPQGQPPSMQDAAAAQQGAPAQ